MAHRMVLEIEPADEKQDTLTVSVRDGGVEFSQGDEGGTSFFFPMTAEDARRLAEYLLENLPDEPGGSSGPTGPRRVP